MQTYTLTNEALKKLFEEGIKIGIKKGYKKGFLDGFLNAMQLVKPAISDGLRHASPICASMMKHYKK